MIETCTLPRFTDTEAATAAKILYNVEGKIERLDGERDLNFKIHCTEKIVVFKIANQEESASMLECQAEIFRLLNDHSAISTSPENIESVSGNVVESLESIAGLKHYCRAVTYLQGKIFATVNPHTPELLESLGGTVGGIDAVLKDYHHNAIQRPLLWNMCQAEETLNRLKILIEDQEKLDLISYFQQCFKDNVLPIQKQLRFGTIHNDANDNNVIVNSDGPWSQMVTGVIDYGDLVQSWVVVDVAVAAAYALLHKSHPLDAAASVVKGYHRAFPLTEIEINVIYDLICMRLCMSVCICAYQKSQQPDNKYLSISEQPAWNALTQLRKISSDFAHFLFRDACGLEPVPNKNIIVKWLENNQKQFSSIMDDDLSKAPLLVIDTSVSSPAMANPATPFNPAKETKKLFRAIEDTNSIAGIGKYDEYRILYTSEDFADVTTHLRTLHLGIDIFKPAGESVYAALAGKVFARTNNPAPQDYGGLIILEHIIEQGADSQGIKFYTLYGHLNPESIANLNFGDLILPGQKLGELGNIHENGFWPPHVHFEIITNLLGETETFFGVGSHAHRNVWLSLCPDPNIVLGIPESVIGSGNKNPKIASDYLASIRATTLGPSLSLSYRDPIHMVRGSMQYLFDSTGQKYLDAVNNVPHVGHCHPYVVQAQQNQAGVLNTNTRYLYDVIQDYAARLLEKFPDPLNVCFFVNSGSEANDLAMRMAINFTGRNDFVILDHAYHGNLSSLIDISPYKHNGPGGDGGPPHIHTAMMPDGYRNSNTDASIDHWLDSVIQQLNNAERRSGAAGFIAESVLGCGGQIVLPDSYLEQVYKRVREFGGLCIADEVQVGFGRVGSHFWAFETQGVVPDIVTLGKPMGNGHPLAAVVTTREIADAFNNGMEYFNTFGGNPISCAIGNAVLEVIENENLQQNARVVGEEFLKRLTDLEKIHPIIGNVRGLGLFLGVELVLDRVSKNPAGPQAAYIAERMKQAGILISTDGPYHNVLKIKPPLCFNLDNVNQFIDTVSKLLGEDFAQPTTP